MAQVSYGTITITDTNDIESIIIEYARNQSTSSAPDSQTGGWSTTRPAWAQGYYIWQRARIHKSGTDASEDEFGTAVCITGSTGQTGAAGRGLTATETKYTNVASGTTQAQVEALAESAWVNSVPSYNSSKPDYWVRIKNTYDKAPTTEYIYYKDNAVGDALAAAAIANSLAQSANENANGAMGQAASNVNEVKRIWFLKNSSGTPSKPTSSTTIYNDNAANHWTTIRPTVTGYRYYYYCEQTTTGGGVKSWSDVYLDSSELSEYEIGAMKTRFQNFFYPGDSNYPGAYAVGKSSSDGLDITDISTYGYNLRLTPTALSIGYNELKAIEIDGATPALNLYKPSKTSQGAQTARLDANGLVLSEGGIKAGTSRTNDFIYLSSANFADTISGHSAGTVSLDNYTATDWRQLIGTKFGVRADGTLYANNAVISGTITVGSGSTIDSGATIGGTSASTVVTNASTGASAATDLATYKTAVANTYATKEALSDVEDQIPDVSGLASKSVAIAEEQLIYIQATSGTNSVSAYPSSSTTTSSYWVTQTGESIPNGTPPDSATGQTPRWTTKRPSYQKNYPVIFVAKQKKTVSGVITCTTPIKDDTTTIIDGGHVTTGTIDASRLSVYDASINKISASAIDVASIQIGQTQVNNLTTDLSSKANSSDSNWLVMITTTGTPDYVTPSVTLKATFYHSGIKATSGFGTPVWTKNGTTTLSGATFSNGESTITVTDMDAFYTCTISSN